MTGLLLALLATAAAGIVVERFAATRDAPGPSPAALPARLAVTAAVFLFWLGIWSRPWLAALSTAITQGAHVFISRRKRELIGEPLVFSDYGLLRLVWKHPDLYYTDFMARPPFLAGVAALAGAVVLWLGWGEAPVLPHGAGLALALAVVGGAWGLTRLARRPPFAPLLARWVPAPDLDRHLGRWGLGLTLAAYGLRWFGEAASVPRAGAPGLPADLARRRPLGPTRVVTVQLESFLDPRRLWGEAGGEDLPGLARARALSRFHGPLDVPAHGAFTMRSEYAVLTGYAPADLGFRHFDPYLSTRDLSPPTLAANLKERGFATAFLHPFRPEFFDRARVMRRLGFDRLLFEDDFPGAERFGPYVSDRALLARVAAEAMDGEPDEKRLVMAVTMENHGPWVPSRFADEPDPVRQYRRHVRNTDAALSELIDALAGYEGRVLLCLFGDHPPILPGTAAAAYGRTDYALLLLGRGAEPGPSEERPLTAHELGRLLSHLAQPAE